MKRVSILAVASALLAVTVVGPSVAEEQELPDHPHMLVLDIELGAVDGAFGVLGWRKCVDLAAGRAVPLHAHHAHLHVGPVNDVLFEHAGHAVVGGAPLSDWEGCAGLEAALPIVFGGDAD
jgi:hypothetical protein